MKACRLPMVLWLALLLAFTARGDAVDWVRAKGDGGPLVWGIEGGLKFALSPHGFDGGNGGPRGLIRLAYPVHADGGYELVNYIAVEPVVNGRKGFSELERSELDRVQGKRFWVAEGQVSGTLWNPAVDVEQLDVRIWVEKFANGAQVYIDVSQRSDAPDEIQFVIHRESGSAPLEYCILTATMGNKVRARELWLRNEVVSSRELYPDYKASDFTPHSVFSLSKLKRMNDGGVMAAISSDEKEGKPVWPWRAARVWNYRGAKVTQYWKKPKGMFRANLQVAVNARYTYWNSKDPIPGGISFENFEMREKFYEGQTFVFGITKKTPAEIGMGGEKGIGSGS